MRLFLLLSFILAPSLLKAEPWLSTRFSQNSAACHSPNRTNLPLAKRRCNLSCQGCHVNPSGGGLRNQYGKWNSNRWLSSFKSDILDHDKRPAPYPQQLYGKH